MTRSKNDYALLWANGMTFGEVYDLIVADIEEQWLNLHDRGEVADGQAEA